MKRMLSILLTVCMLLSMAPAVLAADPITGTCGTGLTWSFDEAEGKLTIEGTGAMTEFANTSAVPWSAYRSAIKTVEIAEGVTTIGKYAFNNHSALTGIVVPGTVTAIGEKSFYGCTSLLTVAIGNGVVEFGAQAFAACSELFAVAIGSSVTEILTKTFQNCNKINQIYYVGSQDEWEDVNIETSNGGLYGFDADNVFYMETPATGSSQDVAWTFDPLTFTLTISGEGAMEDYEADEQGWYAYRKAVRTIVVEPGVTAIGTRAFRYCANANTASIPATVTEIHENAFAYCTGLQDVYYGSSEGAWNAIHVANGNTYLSGAEIHYAGECAHTNTAVKYTDNGDETHTAKTVCTCGVVVETAEPEACTDENSDLKCDLCGGDVAEKEEICDGKTHPNAEYVYTVNKDGCTHSVALSCECGAYIDMGEEGCVDEDADGVCDLCKEGAPCVHENYDAVTKTVCNENNTHTVTVTCSHCRMVISSTTADCTDEDKNNVCDVCEGEVTGVFYSLEDGVLTIYGKGAMEDYSSFTGMPWSANRNNVTEIVIEDGVTHIGARSFYRCIYATKVTIAASVKSIGDSAFYRCDGLKNVEFGGEKADWTALLAATGTNNEKLIGATVEVNCTHPNTTAVATSNNDGKTHTVTTTCSDCGDVKTTTVDCTAGDPAYTKGENGKHTATVKCKACEQTLTVVEETCVPASAYTDNGDRTHTVTNTCPKCEAVTTEKEDCVNEKGDDMLCDLCGADLTCEHPSFAKDYVSNKDNKTHTYGYICTVCGEVDSAQRVEECSAEAEGDVYCDKCGQDFSCQHTEDLLRTETEYYATEKTEVYTHNKMTVVYCDGEGCDLEDGIFSSAFVEEQNCADEDGDDYCDLCERNMLCGHENTTTTNTHNGHETHQMKVTCKICGDVLVDTEVECTYTVSGGACVICKGVCKHEFTTNYTTRTDTQEQHYVEEKCDYCGYEKATVTVDCADVTGEGTVHDGKCDFCSAVVACKHEQKVAYTDCKDGIHTVVKTCDTCATEEDSCEVCAAYWETIADVPCVDGDDADYTCDACKTDFAAAAVNTKAFGTFEAAMDAAQDGDTVVLLKDVILTEQLIIEKDLTLDFGENTTTYAVNENYDVIIRGDVTIRSGVYDLSGYYGIGVTAAGSLTVEGGEFNAAEMTDYLIGNWGTLKISDGEFNGVYCAVNNFAGTTTITGGTFTTEETDYTGEYEAADILANSGLTVSGGIFSKPVDEAYCAEGLVPVENGDGTYGVGKPKVEIEKFNVAGTNMTLGNALVLNFLVKQADVTATGLTAYVTHHADGGDVVYEYAQSDWTARGAYYVFPVGVAASQMTDNIEIVIKDAEGNVYANDYSDSVVNYFGRLYTTTKEEAAKPLMVDMLNYGASAQTYFGYKTETLANAGLTEEQKALATPAVECTNAQVKDDNYYGTTLSLKDCIEMNFIFKGLSGKDVSTMYAEISFVNALGEEKTATLSGDALTAQANGARCQVKVNETVLADASELVTVTLYVDGEVYATAKDSVQSYVQRYVAKNGDDTGLYGNIMKLSVSALNYIKSK